MVVAWMAHIVEQQYEVSHVDFAITVWVRRYISTPFTAKRIVAWMAYIVEQQYEVSHIDSVITIWVRSHITT
jgi:hypothetical protein